ncbi:hypothetical protein, partial [Francisella tularensis]
LITMSLKSWLYDGIFIRHYNISTNIFFYKYLFLQISFSTNIFRINYSCDFLAKLPMLGEVSSLNVSVATGIALYETVRQRTNTI